MKHNEALEIADDESDGDKSEVSYMDVDDDEDSDYSEGSWDSGSDLSEDEGELAAAYFDCLEDDASEVDKLKSEATKGLNELCYEDILAVHAVSH